jgi:soluble epoxide hydrolase / lipid-phosphate phosphatase
MSRLENYYSSYFLGYVFLSAPYQTPATRFDLAAINSLTESAFGFPVFGYWPFFDSNGAGELLSANVCNDSFPELVPNSH